MPDNNEMNDINELLAGLGDELTQPDKQESSSEPSSEAVQQSEDIKTTESSEDKIEELLTGLDANPFNHPEQILDIIDNKISEESQIQEQNLKPEQASPEQSATEQASPEQSDSDQHETGLEGLEDLTLSEPISDEVPPEQSAPEQASPEQSATEQASPEQTSSEQAESDQHETGLERLEDLTLSEPISDEVPPEQSATEQMPPEQASSEQAESDQHETGLERLEDLTLSEPISDDVSPIPQTDQAPTEQPSSKQSQPEMDDIVAPEELPSLDELGDINLDNIEEPSEPSTEPSTETSDISSKPSQDKTKPLDLSERQLKFIAKRIEHFGPSLKENVKKIVFEDSLSQKDANTLLTLILKKKPVKKIKEFVEKKAKIKITPPLLDPDYVRILKEKKGKKIRPHKRKKSKGPTFSQYFYDHILPSLRIILLFILIIGGMISLVWFFVLPPIKYSTDIKKGLSLIQTKEIANIKEAEKLFNEALKIKPKKFEAYLRYAKKYTEIGLYEKASRKLKKFKQFSGETFDYDILLGNLYAKRELYNKALDAYNRALKKKPEDFVAVNSIGQLYFKLGKIQTSKEIYKKYLENHPKNLDAQYRLMQIFIKLKDIEKAENKFSEILQRNKKYIHPEVVTELAKYYINNATTSPTVQKEKFLDRAHVVLKLVITKHKYYAPAYYQMARLEIRRHGIITAKRALEKAIKYDKDKPQYYNLLGKIYYQQKDIKNALLNYKKSINADFNYLPPHYHLAHLSYYDQKNYLKAENEYQQAKILYNSSPDDDKVDIDVNELNYNLAWLKYQNGDYDEALRIWSDFYQQYPDNTPFLLGTGNAYLHIQRYKLAKQQYQNGINKLKILIKEKGIVEPKRDFDKAVYKELSAFYNNLGIAYHFLNNDKQALVNLWQAIEAIKTVGYFNENEKANVNIQLILHPYKNSDNQLLIDESIPNDYKLPEY